MKLLKVFMMPLLLSAFFASCTDDDAEQKTVVDLVAENPDFSILEAAVLHAGVADALKSNSITVFAPTNEAFKTIGINSESEITALDKGLVASILTYHVVPSLVPASAIETKNNAEVTMLDGGTAYVTKNSSGVSVNGASVTSADVKAENGAIVHIINSVLLNESRNIVAIAQAYPQLSYLVAAVLRANEGTTKVVDILSSAGPFTVFAPTNAAFQSAGFQTIESIQQANPETLATILTYHVIAARVYSTNLTTGNVPTAQGSDVLINASTGTVKGTNNQAPANIINVNIPASNGVVHLIDSVLLP